MTFKLLLFTYLIGGLTFLPLAAITAFAVLYYTSPVVEKSLSGPAEDQTKTEKEKSQDTVTEGAASSTFAVLRRYDFQAATAALKDASNTAERGDTGVDGQAGEGVSVYQSMYRTVFDRNRNAANPLQENEATAAQKQKTKSAGRVFYIVLRHGHLMLYDSAVQFEVRHVISLTHYNVSLQDDITSNAADFLESDVFTRRTAVVLTPQDTEAGKKPYYLFGDVNIEKEDFYYALLSSTSRPPIPRPLEIESMIKLQSALHSNSLSQESRAIDALLGRVFLAMHRTPFLQAFVRRKIETKMARIPKPAFIASMACHSLNLGDAAPILSNIKLKDINISGEIVLSLDIKYNGGLNLTVSAAAKLDLGPRFKTRMVSLLLAVVLQRLQGKMLVKIKPPPSNRIWFCFETMPDMELKIEPVVSSRQITYSFVLRAIETRIREAFAEGLVKPNWDDVPFFATAEQRWRGGIWESENIDEVEQEADTGEAAAEIHPLSQRNGKTSSMPTLATGADADSDDLGSVKRRSTANLLAQAAKTAAEKSHAHVLAEKAVASGVRVPKSLRSPSFAPPAALVAVDDASADAVRAGDATTPTKRRWIGRNAQGPAQKRDAAEEMRQVRDRDTLGRNQESNEDLHDADAISMQRERSGSAYSADDASVPSVAPSKAATQSLSDDSSDLEGRHLRGAATDSVINPQRKTILATTAAATAAARQWTWNAVANRKKGQPIFNRDGKQQDLSSEDLPADIAKQQAQANARKSALPSGPVGRGQPLPPPGKPLPGPTTKGLWSAAAAGVASMRKKQAPALPPRRGDRADMASGASAHSRQSSLVDTPIEAPILTEGGATQEQVRQQGGTSDDLDGDFGPWMANDINDETNELNDHYEESIQHGAVPTTSPTEMQQTQEGAMPARKVPPPLPRRPVGQRQPSKEMVAEHVSEVQEAHAVEHEPTLIDLDEPTIIQEQGASAPSNELSIVKPTARAEHLAVSETPPKQTELSDVVSMAIHNGGDVAAPIKDDLSDPEELSALEDEVQAIPAPVDAEAEASGVLDLVEDLRDC